MSTTTALDQLAKHTNRLSKETSPYLLQHQHNPVDWYAWGPEAFEAARKADKPIFLSIGYSTCYWCHVMERESFEDEATAKVMNDNFICIKVDREERPDVDDIYMTAVQLMSGSGGWPMSVFLEPQGLKPFMAGTYFPPKDAFGRPSFTTVLTQMRKAWDTKREEVNKQAETLAEAIRESMAEVSTPVAVGQKEIDLAIAGLMAAYDKIDGGFVTPTQRSPKFPTPVNLDFLIAAGWNQKDVKNAVLHTLDRMAIGGMYDQVGGGFHRYSVDEKWLVPHFEKMLYDQGQLVSTYARAYELTKDDLYAEVLRETMEYVLRDLTSSEGAFLCAQDAEVDGREGKNYLWTKEELTAVLENSGFLDGDLKFVFHAYGINDGTNFRDPHHPQDPPSNVLFLRSKPSELPEVSGGQVSVKAMLDWTNTVLLKARALRPQPSTDDKILAGWNGLMIAGMADGGRVLKEKKYVDVAAKAAKFVLTSMRSKDGSLLRSHRAGESRIEAFLEDYALMIKGLLALHRASGDRQWLNEARTFAQTARAKFWDQSNGGAGGGYFDTLDGQSDLFVRVKSTYDGAIPSGNAVMLNNLLDLHEATGQAAYLDDAAATMKFMSAKLNEQPTGCVLSALALDRMVKKHPTRLEKASVTTGTRANPASGGGGTAPAAAGTPATAKAPTATNPVTASVSPVEVNLKVGTSATINITLNVYKGFHINAHQPGDEFLIGVKIDMTGAEGLTITPDYPKGSEYKSEGISENTIFVHEGTVTIPVKIEQTGKMTGSPKFSVTWQACTHEMCHQPKREMLGVRVIAEK